ncbi:radical SAM family heme chaperone HemW [Parapedobacter koreensis]|uniref:Heme chaperone HemW n=1 Tax=Parapedobacter koreensis TaxID=332977 RepID=A0A1H7SP05_9SPHI|nr:radical SAM family heme chaperone HemW [Parapedobacter koreensis]SEL73207.1 oxygen-independent coproporphyrinogen-3 oxidase [Parapedobacter koreensis]
MAGIYFHIPFCRQACHYCDFHFSTSLKYKDEMLHAMQRELALQVPYLNGQPVESIYFGGGTPSLLEAIDILQLIDEVAARFHIQPDAEITIEANPDDLSSTKLQALKKTPINRFSIGIQSFFEEDLRWMNRAHTADEAKQALQRVQDAGYTDITADLIYGYPLLTSGKWHDNIGRLLDFGIPHISAYSMTVEPQTALAAFIRKGKQSAMDEGQSAAQFEYLMEMLTANGYIHYEISNFARPGHYARHNSNYWKGIAYLGIGPSAHSFNGHSRQWNVSNNAKYIRALQAGVLPYDRESLSEQDKFNEYIMTALRTIWGIDLNHVEQVFGKDCRDALYSGLQPFMSNAAVVLTGSVATLTQNGKLLADHIAAELFV